MTGKHDGPRSHSPPRAPLSRLRIRLLGGFDVSLGERTVRENAFSRRKPHSLVKLLALEPAQRLHRDQMIDLLWPDLPPDAAANQLYNSIHLARKALSSLGEPPGTGLLDFKRGHLALHCAGGIETDVGRFTTLAAQARAGGSAGDLEAAVAAYGGPLLPDDRYEEWTLHVRDQLQETFVELLIALGNVRTAEGRHEAAVSIYERALQHQASDERAHRGLMRARMELGDRAGVERQYLKCVKALSDEYGGEPSVATEKLYTELFEQSGEPFQLPHLPVTATPFLGRRFELSEIAARLSDPACRLLTLVGLGGIGKSRLALEAARRYQLEHERKAFLVSLPELCTTDQLITAIAESLGAVLPDGGDRTENLIVALRNRSFLMILDNAEHLSSATGRIADLLDKAPGITVIAASRQRLGLHNEWVVEVHGLEVPRNESGVNPQRFGAVQLFLETARRVAGGFEPNAEEMPFVRRICQLLQGVPLALELAASWVGVLSCRQLADELERGLDLLVVSSPDIPDRHRSLRNVFEHSWRLLNDTERRYFARLSIFKEGFGLEAAQQVADLPLAVLGQLVAKSLVSKTPSGRFTVHPVLRQFAAEKLALSDETARILAAHSDYYTSLLHQHEHGLSTGSEKQVLHELGPELGNIRQAWDHAVRHAGAAKRIRRAAHALFILYEKLGWAAEGDAAFEQAIQGLPGSANASRGQAMGLPLEPERASRLGWRAEHSEAADVVEGEQGADVHEVLAMVLARRAAFAHRLGKRVAARDLLVRSRELLGTEPKLELAFVLDKLALLTHESGDDGEALELLRQALTIREESGDPHAVATSLNNLGTLSFAMGNFDDADRFCNESLSIQQRIGTAKTAAISLQNLASIAFAQGEQERAERLLAEGLALSRALDNSSLTAIFLGNLAGAAAARGSCEEAEEYLFQALENALEIRAESLALGFLPRFALLLHEQDENERAVELCMLLLCHPLCPPEAKAKAEQQLLELASQLDPGVIAAAQDRGRGLKLDQVNAMWLRKRVSRLSEGNA